MDRDSARDIYISFKYAKSKAEQIKTLSELHACPAVDIVESLLDSGIKFSDIPKRYGKMFAVTRNREYDELLAFYQEEEEKEMIVERYEDAVPAAEQAETEKDENWIKIDNSEAEAEPEQSEEDSVTKEERLTAVIGLKEERIIELLEQNTELKAKLDEIIEDNAMINVENAEHVANLNKLHQKIKKLKRMNKKLIEMMLGE